MTEIRAEAFGPIPLTMDVLEEMRVRGERDAVLISTGALPASEWLRELVRDRKLLYDDVMRLRRIHREAIRRIAILGEQLGSQR